MQNLSDNKVLCGANSYEQKYYFNEEFKLLPAQVKDELKIMCVSYAEAAGGIIIIEFSNDGNLSFKTIVDDADYLFDEIESGLMISRFQKNKEEILKEIELFYKVMYLGYKV